MDAAAFLAGAPFAGAAFFGFELPDPMFVVRPVAKGNKRGKLIVLMFAFITLTQASLLPKTAAGFAAETKLVLALGLELCVGEKWFPNTVSGSTATPNRITIDSPK